MGFIDVKKIVDTFVSLQYNLDNELCKEIFIDNSDHLYCKWVKSGNVLCFYNQLDDVNKHILLSWIITKL